MEDGEEEGGGGGCELEDIIGVGELSDGGEEMGD